MPVNSKKKPASPRKPTFINAARRVQIVQAAIDTFAELGYARSSYAQIARRAALSSTRLISYHFANKDALILEVLNTIYARYVEMVGPAVDTESTYAAKLTAFLKSDIRFMRENRNMLLAGLEIQRNARTAAGTVMLREERTQAGVQNAANILRRGQRAGEFRSMNAEAVAQFMLAMRNALLQSYATDPNLDLDKWGQELATFMERAVRRLP